MPSIPTHLKHKPIVVVENYGNIDGRDAYASNVQGLSLGLAQWNEHGRQDISAKVWRKSGEKWSRLSEELPLHRLLDLCILYCSARAYFSEAYRYPNGYDENSPNVERIGLQGDAMDIALCFDNAFLKEDVEILRNTFAKDDEMLSERLFALSHLLKEMGFAR